MKMLALSKQYFRSGWNNFDLFVVCISLIDIAVSNIGIDGFGVFRAFRLVSV